MLNSRFVWTWLFVRKCPNRVRFLVEQGSVVLSVTSASQTTTSSKEEYEHSSAQASGCRMRGDCLHFAGFQVGLWYACGGPMHEEVLSERVLVGQTFEPV